MKIGVTATREGLTPIQLNNAKIAMSSHSSHSTTLHHGACVGGDEQLALTAFNLGYTIAAHPPINKKALSVRALDLSTIVWEEDDYIARNRTIVDVTDVMLAFPRTRAEELRSGTWSTIRYAKTRNKALVIFWPGGGFQKYDLFFSYSSDD